MFKLHIPFEPTFFNYSINVHLWLEYAAFFIGYRYYVYLRKHTDDSINTSNRLMIILGAAIGALVGSRLIGILENPMFHFSSVSFIQVLNTKTIMGGLFGGLLGVEWTKKIIHEHQSSGDLFTLPIIVGIMIGRVGCFLSGTREFTYGKMTQSFLGMDLGDGVMRHPLALYEIGFLFILWLITYRLYKNKIFQHGDLFKFFMITYFTFRFFMEFLKPNIFFLLGLSTIQWLCVACLLYYYKSFIQLYRYAYKRL